MGRINYLKSAKTTVSNLLNLSKKCTTIKSKYRFIKLSIKFLILLTETFTIDLTEDIIVYTQILDISIQDNFDRIVRFLMKVSSKLDSF